jgi:hypothetical protein
MKAFYVDLFRSKSQIALLAGPFPSEAVARKYERAAFEEARKVDPWVDFDSHGVISITDFDKPGRLNDRLEIDPADLGAEPEQQEAA